MAKYNAKPAFPTAGKVHRYRVVAVYVNPKDLDTDNKIVFTIDTAKGAQEAIRLFMDEITKDTPRNAKQFPKGTILTSLTAKLTA